MITVLYDGKCGLCCREIAFYRKIAPKGRFQWIDVMSDKESLLTFNIRQRDALMALHVFDDDSRCLIGVDAFSVIWKAIPGFRSLGYFVSVPVIRPVARWIYAAFGALRFRLRGYHYCEF